MRATIGSFQVLCAWLSSMLPAFWLSRIHRPVPGSRPTDSDV
jgi:hypothetical protein